MVTDHSRTALDKDFGLSVHVNVVVVAVLILVLALALLARHYMFHRRLPEFEIEEAEFGLGDQKITLRANDLDRTVAYRVWVGLSTRKIGLKIDPDDDVVDEIYNSWYEFLAVTRELIKDVPVVKVRQDSTKKVIQLSIEVLNTGLRPHTYQMAGALSALVAPDAARKANNVGDQVTPIPADAARRRQLLGNRKCGLNDRNGAEAV